MKSLLALLALASTLAFTGDAFAARRTLRCEQNDSYQQSRVKLDNGLIYILDEEGYYPVTATSEANDYLLRSGRYELCLDQLHDGALISKAKRIR